MRTEMDDLLIRGLSSFKVKNGAGAEIYLRLKNNTEMQDQLMNFMADNRYATSADILDEARRISGE